LYSHSLTSYVSVGGADRLNVHCCCVTYRLISIVLLIWHLHTCRQLHFCSSCHVDSVICWLLLLLLITFPPIRSPLTVLAVDRLIDVFRFYSSYIIDTPNSNSFARPLRFLRHILWLAANTRDRVTLAIIVIASITGKRDSLWVANNRWSEAKVWMWTSISKNTSHAWLKWRAEE